MLDPKITNVAAGVVENVTDTSAPKQKEPVEDKPKGEVLKKSDENEQVAFECTDGKDDGKISFGQGLKAFWKGFVNGVKNFFGIGKTGSSDYAEKKQEIEEEIKQIDEAIKKDIESSQIYFN